MKKIRKEYYFIAVLLILFILLTIFVVGGKADIIDESFFNNVIKLRGNGITSFLYIITELASTIGIVALLGLTSFIFIKHKAFSDFKYVIANVSIGVVLMQVLKNIFKRVRPSWKWITQGGFSYPSGHTISALLLYGTLMLLVYKKVHGKTRKPLLVCLILGSIILIISNMFMNKEFNNDKNKDRKTIQTK